MFDTVLKLCSDLQRIYLHEYNEFSEAQIKKMDPNNNPIKSMLNIYDYKGCFTVE